MAQQTQTLKRFKISDIFQKEQTFTIVALLVLIVVMAVINPDFLGWQNLSNITRQVSINAIIAVGMTFVILTGGVDLSVGSVMALSGTMMAGFMIKYNMSPVVAVLLGIIIGAVCGIITGSLVAYAKIPGIIASLAMMEMARGIALIYTGGYPLSGLSSSFSNLGNGNIGIVPIPLIVTAVIYLIAYLILNQSATGRYTYALGGNEEAVRLSGINIKKFKALPYIISGITAAMAGAILVSRMQSGQPNAGTGFELDAIAAVVLGGTAISGGRGHILGTIIGALTLAVLSNGLNFMGVTPYVQRVIKGAIIVVAVIIASRKKD